MYAVGNAYQLPGFDPAKTSAEQPPVVYVYGELTVDGKLPVLFPRGRGFVRTFVDPATTPLAYRGNVRLDDLAKMVSKAKDPK